MPLQTQAHTVTVTVTMCTLSTATQNRNPNTTSWQSHMNEKCGNCWAEGSYLRLEPTTQLAVSVSTTTMILCFIAVLNKYTVTVTVTMMKNTRLGPMPGRGPCTSRGKHCTQSRPTAGPCQQQVNVYTQGQALYQAKTRLHEQHHITNSLIILVTAWIKDL